MPIPTRFHARLARKVALVTGAGSRDTGVGIGKAIAYWFACEGARVCLVDRDTEHVERTLGMICAAGGEAFACTADVTQEADCARAVAAVVARFGRLDVLVDNVGAGAGSGPIESLAPEAFDQLLRTNLTSAFLMSRAAMPALLAARGNVVNIASTAALRAHGAAAYGPSKAALVQFTRELAVLYGRSGLRANCIAPGHLFTPMVERSIDAGARVRRRRIAPLDVEGDAWDVAAAALFLASDEARFVSGVCLPVDGGVTQVAALTAHEMM